MKNKYRTALTYIILFISFFLPETELHAQGAVAGIDVEEPQSTIVKGVNFSLSLDKKDWTYHIGDKPVFIVNIQVDGVPVDGVDVRYSIGPEKMGSTKRGTVSVVKGIAKFAAETMNEPGFLRCYVSAKIDGKLHKAAATAAFDPEKIKPTTAEPLDFDQFWSNTIKEGRSIPLNPKLTPIESRSNDSVAVYQVEYDFFNDGIQKGYGVLSKPKKAGKYPAIIRFPGAGWAPSQGDQVRAAEGYITFHVYIHGKPVIHDRSYYVDLQKNELKDYRYQGLADRDSFYYKNGIIRCVRAVDFIYSLAEFDGANLGSWGSSQGGALSIITTALESRIKSFVALCPAMSDFTGYFHHRAGGWPHFFAKPHLYEGKKKQVMETLSYYDVVNFAKRVHVPGFFSWGFNDEATPPTSFYAAYNVIKSPKQVFIIPEGIHKIYPEQNQKTYTWLKGHLTPNTNTEVNKNRNFN